MSRTFVAGPQSGGRPPAPGRLALVQALVNSHFDLAPGPERGADLWRTPTTLARWLDGRDLPSGRISRSDLERAVSFREGLRARLAEHNDKVGDPTAEAGLRDAATGLSTGYAFASDRTTVPVPAGSGVAAALGLVLAVVHEAQTVGTWRRLKACPGSDCGWVFYDTSRNASSHWCSMDVCGGRQKSRAYRLRHRGES